MRSSYAFFLILSLVAGGTYWYQSTAYICPAPLEYRLGNLDEEFGVSSETAIDYIAEAETYWEEATGRDLFIYNDNADFTIDFVFDERQEAANDQELARIELDKKWVASEGVREALESLQVDYDELVAIHTANVSIYERDLNNYNNQVNRYNDQGGAPSEIFAELEEERRELGQTSRDLNQSASNLNDLVEEINDLSQRGNELVDAYNLEVSVYNELYGRAGEFTQGDYQGDRINIYKFSTSNEVITVLAHEFGHALGLGHVEDESALMYYLLEDPNSLPSIVDADLKLFYEVCGTEDTFAHKARRAVRNLLSIF